GEGDGLFGTEVGEPVPTVDALAGQRDAGAEGRDGSEEGVGAGGQGVVQADVALLVEDGDVHGPCVQVDAAVRCRGEVGVTQAGLLKGGETEALGRSPV